MGARGGLGSVWSSDVYTLARVTPRTVLDLHTIGLSDGSWYSVPALYNPGEAMHLGGGVYSGGTQYASADRRMVPHLNGQSNWVWQLEPRAG